MKKRIMFVCHGNICRSPSAEFIMKKLIAERHLQDLFEISSSATSGEEIYGGIGNPVYPPMKLELEKHGIDCSGKRAARLVIVLAAVSVRRFAHTVPSQL